MTEIGDQRPADNRTRLRQATQAQHDAAERFWAGAGALHEAARYHAFLRALLEVHLAFGRGAARVLGAAAEEEARIAALCRDLGCAVPERCETVLTRAGALGVAYVLGGSAMGAAILLKRGRLPDAAPVAYLTHMRGFARSGALAAQFRALNAADLDQAEAIAAARAVFAMMEAGGMALQDV